MTGLILWLWEILQSFPVWCTINVGILIIPCLLNQIGETRDGSTQEERAGQSAGICRRRSGRGGKGDGGRKESRRAEGRGGLPPGRRLRVECFRLQGARRCRFCGGRTQGFQRQEAGDLPQARGGQGVLRHQRQRKRKR